MQAGCRGGPRRAATRYFGASGPPFPSLFDVDREPSRAATHVDARDGVLSDAGSASAAPPPQPVLPSEFADSVDPVASMLPNAVPVLDASSSRMAPSIAAGLKCMY